MPGAESAGAQSLQHGHDRGGLGAGSGVFDVGNPITLAPGKTRLFALFFECCRGRPKYRGFHAIECIDAYDSVETPLDSAGDYRHDAAPGANVEYGGLRSEAVFGDVCRTFDRHF